MASASETPVSRSRVYAAPLHVEVDGQMHDRTSKLVLAMEMAEQEGGMSSMQLRYSNLVSHPSGNASLAFEDEQLLKLGSPITVYVGAHPDLGEVFRGKITALEAEFSQHAPPELVVHAEDALQTSRLKRQTALHRDTSIAKVARSVAERAHLKPVIDGLDAPLGDRLQFNQSDLAFLRHLLREYDADMQVVGTDLHVAARSTIHRKAIHLELYSQLQAVRIMADLAHQTSQVSVAGWDPQASNRVSHVANGTHLGPGRGRTGAQLLPQTLGARPEHLSDRRPLTKDQAREQAQSAFDQRARRFVQAECTAVGNPGLRVGVHVELSGLSPRFDNTYYVTSVCHRYDLQVGYTTDFEAECAYLGETA